MGLSDWLKKLGLVGEQSESQEKAVDVTNQVVEGRAVTQAVDTSAIDEEKKRADLEKLSQFGNKMEEGKTEAVVEEDSVVDVALRLRNPFKGE